MVGAGAVGPCVIEIDGKGGPAKEKKDWFTMNESQRLIVCCAGIFVCYFYYGIVQEKITRVPYGEDKEKFTFTLTLVFMQCVINALFAYTVVKATYNDQNDHTPSFLYAICAVTYMGAMLSSNAALRFVKYPTQVLGKSCKPIPVMILGVLLARKRYPLIKYLCVMMIVLGVALFLYKDKKNTTATDSSFGFGEILLLMSLTLDGLTGVSQERMRAHHKTQSHHMMLSINKWSILLLGVAIVVTGEIWRFVDFCTRYPYVLGNMLMFGMTSAIGQNFIFMTVTSFGPLTCSIVTTTRKFFTILFSVLFFGNSLLQRQWLAVVIVFLGLSMDSYFGKSKKK